MIDSLFAAVRSDYRDVFLQHPQPLLVYDRATLRFLDVNDAACVAYGYTRKKFVRMTLDDVRTIDDLTHVRERGLARGDEPTAASRSSLVRHRRADGTEFYVDVTSSAVSFENKPATILLAIDATQRLVVSQALSQSRVALAEAQELARLGSYEEDLLTGDVTWSGELFRILCVDPTEERPQPIETFDHPSDAAAIAAEVDRSKRERTAFAIEHRVLTRDGRERRVLERGRFFFHPGSDEPHRAIGAVLDVTDRRDAEEQMRFLANHDALTSLPNRALLEDRLDRATQRAALSGSLAAVLFVNLDRFKAINDSLSRGAGDRVIRATAERLAASVGASATVARLGGDEFVVVVETFAREAAAISLAHLLLSAIARPIDTGTGSVSVSATIGVALFPRDGKTSEDLLRNADAAMAAAKVRGGNAVELYAPHVHARALHEAGLERALRHALEAGTLDVAYQPIVDVASHAVTGCEALARWTLDGVAIGPNEFVPIAEATGMIDALGAFVLERACVETARIVASGFGDFTMSVNISARQFQNPDFASGVRRALDAARLDARHLQLEITESAYLDVVTSMSRLRELEAIGVSLSIDDFGTGFSSLAYLKRLPVAWLKIDRSFVENIEIDAADQAIVCAIVAVAQNLGLRTIAEGVETIAQAEYLRAIGCTRLQGFYFSRPLPAVGFASYLKGSGGA